MVAARDPAGRIVLRTRSAGGRVLVLWCGDDTVDLTVERPADTSSATVAADVLGEVCEFLAASAARHVRVDLSRVEGGDVDLLELLAAVWHRYRQLRTDRGCLRVHGVRHRLVTRPEVSAFPELFGPVSPPHPGRGVGTGPSRRG